METCSCAVLLLILLPLSISTQNPVASDNVKTITFIESDFILKLPSDGAREAKLFSFLTGSQTQDSQVWDIKPKINMKICILYSIILNLLIKYS